MEYIYAAMLLHKAGQKITEDSVKKVLEAAGVKADSPRIKALVTALEGVDIEDVVKNASIASVVPAAPVESEKTPLEEKKEEKKEEKEADDGAAAAGMGALFG